MRGHAGVRPESQLASIWTCFLGKVWLPLAGEKGGRPGRAGS